MKLASALILPALLLCSCIAKHDPKGIAIVGARLGALEHSIVIIEGKSIVASGSQSSVPLPQDLQIVDGMGKTVLPTGSTKIEVGQPANLVLKDDLSARTMKDGQWVN